MAPIVTDPEFAVVILGHTKVIAGGCAAIIVTASGVWFAADQLD